MIARPGSYLIRAAGRVSLALKTGILILLSLLLAGCGTVTPDYVQPSGSGWDVHTVSEEVQASIVQISPLTIIPLDQTNSLIDDGYVWTGYDGMAELTRPDDAPGCTIYTFYQTEN